MSPKQVVVARLRWNFFAMILNFYCLSFYFVILTFPVPISMSVSDCQLCFLVTFEVAERSLKSFLVILLLNIFPIWLWYLKSKLIYFLIFIVCREVGVLQIFTQICRNKFLDRMYLHWHPRNYLSDRILSEKLMF